jgi:hypothetical protein
MPKSKKRAKAREQRVLAAQREQRKKEDRRLTPEQHMRRRAFGWSLVGLAVLVGVTHWLAHLGALYEDRALWDLTIGYPTAGALAVVGILVLSKTSI